MSEPPFYEMDVNDLKRAGLLPADMRTGPLMFFPDLDDPTKDIPFEDDSAPPEVDAEDDAPPVEGEDSGDGWQPPPRGPTIQFKKPTFDQGDHAEIAEKVMEILTPDRTRLVHDCARQYLYEPDLGCWTPLEPEFIRWIVFNFRGCMIQSGFDPRTKEPKTKKLAVNYPCAQGAERFVADSTHITGFFDDAPPGVAFKNGFVEVREGQVFIKQNDQRNRVRHAFPFDYDPDAKHPETDTFFEEVFSDCNEEERANRVAILQEFAGAALLGMATKYQKCVLLYGPGGTGKSQWASICLSMFPRNSTASLPPHRWGERFDLSHLAGVMLNVVSELPEAELVNTEAFKSIIVGDQVTAERKFMPAFDFSPRAAHMFSTNAFPATADITDAFFRRFIIVPFMRNMLQAPCYVPDIGKKIAEKEQPGLSAWSIEGAARLQRQGRYTESQTSRKLIDEWRTSNDKVSMFVTEFYDRIGPNDSVYEGTKASILYKRYKEWSMDGSFKTVSRQTFNKRMETVGMASVRVSEGVYYPVRPKEGSNEP